MKRRDETGFRHGMRVRLGAGGPKGKLLRCEKRDGTGHYWKVRQDNGQWAWPDGLVIDCGGEHLSHCHQCRLPFLGDLTDLLCTPCQRDQFGTPAERAAEPRDIDYTRSTGTYHRRRSHS